MKQTFQSGAGLRAAVLIALAGGLILPIGAGLWQTGRAAFGVFPAIGATAFTLEPWAMLLDLPGLDAALQLSLFTGLTATGLSLALAVAVCATLHQRLPRGAAARLLSPFLAVPHAAMAIGLAFVLAPSGWIARALALPFGWDRPPDLATVNDPWGIALIVGLMVKEVPFLLLVILSAQSQIPTRLHMAAARSLGYGRRLAWLKIILPQVWPLIRLPVLVVLAYSVSVVDMAMILGPSTPPTLAVVLTRLFSDPDLARILPGSAGGLVQLVLAGVAMGLLIAAERLIRVGGQLWIRRGGRGTALDPLLGVASIAALILSVTGVLAMLSIAVWSLAWRWTWPMLLPESWSVKAWATPRTGWADAMGNTLAIAICATGLCLTLAIAWLESEDRARMERARWAEGIIYLPLLIPQVSFLFGMNVLFYRLGLSGRFSAVVWAQSLFVFPYVMIALSDPWRARDKRLDRSAASLGAGPWRLLFRVKLPVLLAPILTAAAIGIAVSVAQYLPTLFMGAGRIATLTTEAVTLSSSSDRRVVGVYATLQAALPFLGYVLAFLLPALLHHNRRDLLGEIRT
ncbi:ABC transporter permease [Pseudooceanicola algae]|uniref:Inner membrane ABC transporter permease protein YnjC n=1 Tax=Pseudooceanicola algae TaxID=1537215 RepID=A0A418SBM5_9RHOB|nr:ABC transporter permease subunit [Pseudooceanicola algae]QPM92471.1 Inner membrane ABC transporter permease protein YnjC [Pseudooceanicola algae]